MFKPLARLGDMNQMGGKILNGAKTVIASMRPVGLHPSPLTPHPPKKHKVEVTTTASLTVFCENKPVLRVGSFNSLGHSIVTGSSTIFVS